MIEPSSYKTNFNAIALLDFGLRLKPYPGWKIVASRSELASESGLSENTVVNHIRWLLQRGAIVKIAQKAMAGWEKDLGCNLYQCTGVVKSDQGEWIKTLSLRPTEAMVVRAIVVASGADEELVAAFDRLFVFESRCKEGENGGSNSDPRGSNFDPAGSNFDPPAADFHPPYNPPGKASKDALADEKKNKNPKAKNTSVKMTLGELESWRNELAKITGHDLSTPDQSVVKLHIQQLSRLIAFLQGKGKSPSVLFAASPMSLEELKAFAGYWQQNRPNADAVMRSHEKFENWVAKFRSLSLPPLTQPTQPRQLVRFVPDTASKGIAPKINMGELFDECLQND